MRQYFYNLSSIYNKKQIFKRIKKFANMTGECEGNNNKNITSYREYITNLKVRKIYLIMIYNLIGNNIRYTSINIE